MSEAFDVLESSVARLRALIEPLGGDQLRAPAYPKEWTIADVLSHIGSSGVILQARLDAALSGRTLADDFAQPIWDVWNAKSPEAQAADGLAADRALFDRIASLTDEEQARLLVVMGPLQLDLAGLIQIRLNEHVVHTWDVDVALDPGAVLPTDAAELVIDELDLIVRYTGKWDGADRELHVRTTDPRRDFTLALHSGAVTLDSCDAEHASDLELPAEALIRLVYGRLDADHTPATRGSADLDELRPVFPGP